MSSVDVVSLSIEPLENLLDEEERRVLFIGFPAMSATTSGLISWARRIVVEGL